MNQTIRENMVVEGRYNHQMSLAIQPSWMQNFIWIDRYCENKINKSAYIYGIINWKHKIWKVTRNKMY